MRGYIRRVDRTTVPHACPRDTRERARIDFLSSRGRLRARFVNLAVLAGNEGKGSGRKSGDKRNGLPRETSAIFIVLLRRISRTEMQSVHDERDEKARRSSWWFARISKSFDAS